jgi:hypothetical protein
MGLPYALPARTSFIQRTKKTFSGIKRAEVRYVHCGATSRWGGNLSQPDFEQVFLPHLDAAYNLARWLLRNDQDAEDAVQEAYMRAYKAFARFRGGDGKAWFMTILRNVCYTMIKKLRSHETPEPFDEEIHQPRAESEMREAFRQKANAESLHCALENCRTSSGKSSCCTIWKVSPTRKLPRRRHPHRHRHVAARPGAGTIARRDRRLKREGVLS